MSTKATVAVTAATSMASSTWRQGRWMYLQGTGGALSLPNTHFPQPLWVTEWGRPHSTRWVLHAKSLILSMD